MLVSRHAALKSVNNDLWKSIFAHVDATNITLQIYWVPGHLDTKVPQSRVRVEDVFFALNFCADKFADAAALEAQLDMNPVSSVLFNSSLVKKIQRRLTRILVSHLEKHKYDKRFPLQKEAKPTFQHFVQATSHNLQVCEGRYVCMDCHASVGKSSVNIINWLKSPCHAAPFDDSLVPARVPGWYRIQRGNNMPHSSHDLMSMRGVLFCMSCGFYGAKKFVRLSRLCDGHCSTSSELARDKLMSGKLPANLRSWPRLGCKTMQPQMVQHDAGGGALGTLPDNAFPSEALCQRDQDLSSSVPTRDSLAGPYEKFPETMAQHAPISQFDDPDFDLDFDDFSV